MPYEIRAGTLQPGDVHEISFRYNRWIFANTHEGRMLLQILDVEDGRVTTRFIEDTSYISHYLKLEGTEIRLSPAGQGRSDVRLTIKFERKLDPAWYFGPLERFAVGEMSEFLIEEVVARNE